MGTGRYNALIFDLDGTLVDSLGDIAASVNRVLLDMKMEPQETEFYRKKVGWGLKQTLALTLPHLDSAALEKVLPLLLKYYRKDHGVYSQIYEGITETVTQLREQGISLFVYTNKDQITAERVIENKFSGKVFSGVFGAVSGSALKPDSGAIRRVIQKTGHKADEILYIGDSEIDMETAVNGNLDSLAVLWGYRSREELEDYPKLAFIERPDEIINWII